MYVLILSGKDLKNRIYDIIPSVDKRLFEQGWACDLRLGEQIYITSDNMPIRLSEENNIAVIKPGEFALLITEEYVNMPFDLMGFITVKFTYKKLGLINISGFHVDPGYQGRIIFSVYNAGPNDILLRKGSPIFMIFFNIITDPLDIYAHRQGLSEQKFIRKGYEEIPLEMISLIKGSSVSLIQNTSKINKLESDIKLYGSIALSIIATMLGVILAKVLN